MDPALVFATPRKLPNARVLNGRVVVLDIAFAAEGTGASFEKITAPFIRTLGSRLVAWVDHHDHELHAQFANDSRFVLARKSEYGSCPEMISSELVARIGRVDTIVCHDDLDGVYAAAKWLRSGQEPYAGADADARAVDTRMGQVGLLGTTLDRALRARTRDEVLRARIVRFLVAGASAASLHEDIVRAAEEFERKEDNARMLAQSFVCRGVAAVVDASGFAARVGLYDKTLVLLLGQKIARVAVVYDEQTVTLAAAFDSGVDFLKLLGIRGGMPTRVSVPRERLAEVLALVETLA